MNAISLLLIILTFSFVITDDVELKEQVKGESYQAEVDIDQKSIN
jgi:hypothetical protein